MDAITFVTLFEPGVPATKSLTDVVLREWLLLNTEPISSVVTAAQITSVLRGWYICRRITRLGSLNIRGRPVNTVRTFVWWSHKDFGARSHAILQPSVSNLPFFPPRLRMLRGT